ncbi:Arsenate reductase [Mycobacteroides salmoniphilum]|nr:Arsenate reductase [Mycobacteroides salmoniphilum]TDZ88420.1 Arsenate reductase [Mycobacteroides salmoniphilum]
MVFSRHAARTCKLGVVDATIYHNPRCTKSRQALARLEEAGADITVVKYLDDVLTKAQLKALITDAGLTVREAVRTGEAEYKELGLAEASDEALLDAMIAHPRLIQRPFVVTANGTRMARPTEAIDEIL